VLSFDALKPLASDACPEQYLWGPDARAVLDPVATENGLNAGSGTGEETVSDAHPG
jgi:hypothetical protein